MASRSIDLISKKNKLHVQHTFFLISKKTNLHVQHAFCLSLPLFCTTTTLFCWTKTPNCLLLKHVISQLDLDKTSLKLKT